MDNYIPKIVKFDDLETGMKIKKDGRIFTVVKKSNSEVILSHCTYHKYDTYAKGNKWDKEDFNKAKFKYYEEQRIIYGKE